MNRTILSLLILFLSIQFLFSQTPDRPNAFTGKRLWSDHQTTNGEGSIADFTGFGGGFEIAYLRNLGQNINFGLPAQLMVIDLPNELENLTTFSIDALGQYQFYRPGARVIPYLSTGVGGVLEEWEDLDFQLPINLGVNFRFGDHAFISTQAGYRLSLDGDRDHFQYGIGLGFYLGKVEETKKKPKVRDKDVDGIDDFGDDCPEIPGVVAFKGCPDTDADGIEDRVDICPEIPGTKETNGCPDQDKDTYADDVDDCPTIPGTLNGCPDDDQDGVANQDDDCPNQAGPAANRGCPSTDRDGDGVPDAEDKCPDEVGPLNGCPDQDNDGFADNIDPCPNTAAPLSKNGCPEIKKEDKEVLDYAVQAVQFEFSSDNLKTISYPVLDQVRGVLDKYPGYQLQITGHTDSVGNSKDNEALSIKRANSCYLYLVSKGVNPDRLIVTGQGESQPIADNNTEEGRSLNRRVEFLIVPQ